MCYISGGGGQAFTPEFVTSYHYGLWMMEALGFERLLCEITIQSFQTDSRVDEYGCVLHISSKHFDISLTASLGGKVCRSRVLPIRLKLQITIT